ncbi:MAG: cytochrome c family protein [Desulfobacterales bacterium]|nr:cytochrome c family protein [Desulfobacterales bacterium]
MLFKKKGTSLLIILTVIMICFSASFVLAQPETITLNEVSDDTGSRERSPVTFEHESHMDSFECLDCHHDYDESGENILDEGDLEEGNPDILCSACHNDDTKVDRQTAFHRQCMGCHIDERDGGNKAAPDMCGQCHL